jgi:hypothetical protein
MAFLALRSPSFMVFLASPMKLRHYPWRPYRVYFAKPLTTKALKVRQ